MVVSGWTGAGKSTISDGIAAELGATVASFDWLMSALRAHDTVWRAAGHPVEQQRAIGWELLGRVAEQQLRAGRSCVLDLVAREAPRRAWEALARRYGATLSVVECVCSDEEVHRTRVDGRRRGIPGWYELDWDQVRAGRSHYRPLAHPKVVLDAIDDLNDNLNTAMSFILADPASSS